MLLSKSRLWLYQHKEVFVPAILIFGAFLGGLVCGALTLRTLHSAQVEELRHYLNRFLEEAKPLFENSTASGFQTWCRVLNSQLSMMGILWILGLTVVGVPFIVLTVGIRGFILGFTIGFLVKEHSLRGILLAMVAILPQNLCYIPAFLGAGSVAFYFSFSLLRGFHEGPVLGDLLVYTLLFVLLLLIAVVGTWIEAYFVPGLVQLVVSFT